MSLENELDVWLEYTRMVGPIVLAAGVTSYFRNYHTASDDPEHIANTSEVYARLRTSPLSVGTVKVDLEVSAFYDVDEVKGGYFEPRAVIRLPFKLNTSLFVGLAMGVNSGQGCVPAPVTDPATDSPCELPVDAEGYYFERSGITHLELSVALPLVFKSTTYGLAAHGFKYLDPLTKTSGSFGFSVDVSITAGL